MSDRATASAADKRGWLPHPLLSASLVLVWLLLQNSLDLGNLLLGLVLGLGTLFGFWLCGRVAEDLGVQDHEGIVWDEMVGMWITLWLVPPGWQWLLLGFLMFRFFDILKPWPIRWIDRHVHGGVGIMLDDVLAGIFAWLAMHALLYGVS